MQRFLLAMLCAILVTVHLVSLEHITVEAKGIAKGDDTAFVIPSPILRITALEFRGLASDFLFLKGLVFIGSTFERTELPRLKPWEWKWLYHIFDASTNLDPYFYDPYYVGNTHLAWEGGEIKDANLLLEKGLKHRDWDPLIPFYMGFNYFYFLNENDMASTYLMQAARRPNASPLYGSLAARLAYKGHKTENAILFLEEILKETMDEITTKYFEARLESLKNILSLEKAVSAYKKKFGRTPTHIAGLVNKGIISHLPKDPFGGSYHIEKDGKVRSTTSSELEPYLSPFQKKAHQKPQN